MYLYVLRSDRTGRRYVGSCANIVRRFHEHNTRQSKSTRHGVPWTIIYLESATSREFAVQRERFLKTGRGREFIDAQLK
ncbi:MAG: GIY-YIG nuclease family protein [Planctomycetota bacterium]